MSLILHPQPEYFDLIGLHENIENEVYHRQTKGVSSSILKECLKSEKAYRDYISGGSGKKKTKKMDFGSIVNDYLLLPHLFKAGGKYQILKHDPDVTEKENKEYMDEWHSAHPGKHLITEEVANRCKEIKKEFFSHKIIKDIYDSSIIEASCFVDSHLDPDDPKDFIIRKKCRPDIHIPKEGMVFDIKLSESSDEDLFRKIIELFDYDLSAAWYLDILSEYYQTEFKYFGFIVIESNPPHNIEIYILDEDGIEKGRNRYIRAEKRYKEFLLKGNDPKVKKAPEFKFITTSKWRG